jgi:hypothetical protein
MARFGDASEHDVVGPPGERQNSEAKAGDYNARSDAHRPSREDRHLTGPSFLDALAPSVKALHWADARRPQRFPGRETLGTIAQNSHGAVCVGSSAHRTTKSFVKIPDEIEPTREARSRFLAQLRNTGGMLPFTSEQNGRKPLPVDGALWQARGLRFCSLACSW